VVVVLGGPMGAAGADLYTSTHILRSYCSVLGGKNHRSNC